MTGGYHHGNLRDALVRAGVALLRKGGPQNLSLRAVAQEAGVSRAAPYHHFKDKRELLCAIAEQGFRQFVGVLTIEDDNLSEARMGRFVRDYLDFALKHSEYYDLMFGSQLWKSQGITDTLQQEAHGSFRFYVEQVRDWQERGQINPEIDVLRYSQVSWGTLHGLSRLLIDGIYLDRQSMGPMCDQAASMFWRELTAE